ncbi:MAG TPA: lytic transglycosylase domain-containing protein [Alphaproteobacteria bacterium]|nr:lytic transglycosylase domain-containing protein [Alphaproteobacteria bacterium]
MHNPVNIIIKYIIYITLIIILYFTLHPKHLLANNVDSEISKSAIIEIIKLINNNQWKKAEKILENNNKKELINLANWLKISSKNNFEKGELLSLYSNYKEWPNINNLVIKIEAELTWENFNQEYFDFFISKEPISPIGKIKLSSYKIKNKIDNAESYNEIIINNWVNGDFKKEDETYIITNYSQLFDEKIHFNRLNNLIWKKKWSSVNRQIKRVNKKFKLLATAKIKLSRRQYGVDYAVKNVPIELIHDEGLIYERVKWRRKSGLDKESYQLLKSFLIKNKTSLTKPDKWWHEINWHTRNLFHKKKYKEAYELLSNHKQTKISNIANAEWFLGWLALSFINKPENAKKHFLNMKNIVKMPISISRVNYWLALTEEVLMNKEAAQSYYEIAGINNTTFYGLLANLKINKDVKVTLIEDKILEDQDIKINIDILNTLKLISRADEQKFSLKFLNSLFKQKLSNNNILHILNVLKRENRIDLYLRACKKAVRIDSYFQKCLFPYPYNIKINNINTKIEPALIIAIAKQESEFFINAKSPSGALGLVQVMPNTAKITANNIGIKYDKNKLFNDPDYNLTIGSNYLYSLINNYNGSIVLAIAAYNAGPTNVNKWLKKIGDPRKKEIDYVTWIESIPFTETRNYVQRVLENFIIYQQIIIDNSIKNKKNISDLL